MSRDAFHKDQSRPSHYSNSDSGVRTNRRDSSSSSALNDFEKPSNYQHGADNARKGTRPARFIPPKKQTGRNKVRIDTVDGFVYQVSLLGTF
jgi:hypothetical protein